MVNTVQFNTDVVMRNCWHTLVSDFRAVVGKDFCKTPSELLKDSIEDFRDYNWPNRMKLDVYTHKCLYQLQNFFKRYSFQTDKYTPEELEEMALAKELKNIQRLSTPFDADVPHVSVVLTRAREIVHEILGDFNWDEVYEEVEFGKRACVGTLYEDSYLDWKLYASPLTGSKGQFDRFFDYIKKDHLLQNILLDAGKFHLAKRRVDCSCLKQSYVPKKFDSLRGITLNTLIGTFISGAIGNVMAKRLKDYGLNIKKLQEKHGVYARIFSNTRTHATADLSLASQSITKQHIDCLFSVDWADAMEEGRIKLINLAGDVHRTPTYAGMGIGFTFPLQTILFYSLLEAIRTLTKTQGFVSVYGDDLVYPRRIHRYVSAILPRLNFILNEDKTYVEENFRESCGSDFYRGVDVRPFSYEGRYREHSRTSHAAFLYTVMNGLLTRWDKCEIPKTILFLEKELMSIGDILLVPPFYPVFSGLRVEHPRVPVPWYMPVSRPKFQNLYFKGQRTSSGQWIVESITPRREYRPVFSTKPYYWLKLASMGRSEPSTNVFTKVQDVPAITWRTVKFPTRQGKKVKEVARPFCILKEHTTNYATKTQTVPIWTAA